MNAVLIITLLFRERKNLEQIKPAYMKIQKVELQIKIQ